LCQVTPTKGLLKTPGSTNKRKSVCFVDKRNELAHCVSRNDDPDFQPGIIRAPVLNLEEPPSKTSKNKRTVDAANRSPDVRGGKRRRVEATSYAGVTIAKHCNGVSYIELQNNAPGVEDIEEFFVDAANKLFADILAGTAMTPEKYMADGRWVGTTPGKFKAPKQPQQNPKRKSTGEERTWAEETSAKVAPKTAQKGPAPVAEPWATGTAKAVLAMDEPTPKEVLAVQEQVKAGAAFLFQVR
jgi:hypothetical protein